MSDTGGVWNYFIENVRYSKRVLDYSLRYTAYTILENTYCIAIF